MAEEIKTPETEESGKNFILNFIDEDIAEGLPVFVLSGGKECQRPPRKTLPKRETMKNC